MTPLINPSPVERAILYALQKHEGQLRKDSELPYIVHPVEVMKLLTHIGITDTNMLCAAVLHDVVEDTPVTDIGLRLDWGNTIADLVDALTRRETVSKTDYMESFRTAPLAVKAIKLCDRYCNARDYIRAGKYDTVRGYSAKALPLIEGVLGSETAIIARWGTKTWEYMGHMAYALQDFSNGQLLPMRAF